MGIGALEPNLMDGFMGSLVHWLIGSPSGFSEFIWVTKHCRALFNLPAQASVCLSRFALAAIYRRLILNYHGGELVGTVASSVLYRTEGYRVLVPINFVRATAPCSPSLVSSHVIPCYGRSIGSGTRRGVLCRLAKRRLGSSQVLQRWMVHFQVFALRR